MSNDILRNRLQRLYAAIEAVEEHDLSKLPANIICTEKLIGVVQDFRGDLSDAEIENDAVTVIYNIAHLHDHLKKWAADHGVNPQRVTDKLKSCQNLKIIRDLSNIDKHGESNDPKFPPWSGKRLVIKDLGRCLRLETSAENRASVSGYVLGADGIAKTFGDGRAFVITTGSVFDQNGDHQGDLYTIESNAVKSWESLLTEFGLTP